MKKLILLFAFLIPAMSSFGQAPTTNATDPEARNAEDVISIFSGAYTDVVGTNYNPNWGQSGFATANTGYDPGTGNLVLAYPGFNYQGNVLGTVQNISAMEFLHVDIWVNGTFDPKIVAISSGAEIPQTITNTGAATWISVDIPVAGITNDPTQVKELKFDGGSGTDSIYVDNVYFWKTATTPQNDATLSDLQVDGTTVTDFSSGVTNYTVGLASGTTTVPQITTATTTEAAATTTITQATEIPGDATVEVVSDDETRTRTYTVSFAITSPGVAAPAPPARDAADVISIFSDEYTDIAVETFSGVDDNSDITEVMIAGNPTKRIDFTNFLQVEFKNNKQDASEMSHFHMDFWVNIEEPIGKVFNSKLVDFGGTAAETSAMELNINGGSNPQLQSGTWVSIDVPLDSWVNNPSIRSDLAQFVMTSNLDIVFVDNIYMYRDPNATVGLPESFDVASSITTWTTAGDAAAKASEVTLEWAETAGVDGSGAMRFGGTNADAVGGRAYILEKTFNDIDFSGETNVDVSVSIKTEGIDNANISVLTDIAGSIQQNASANADLSDTEFTTFTFNHPAISGTANTVKVQFNVAAGAIVGAGGTLLIDDISVAAGTGGGGGTDTPPTTAAPIPVERNAEDVLSIFSDAYTNIALDALSADFDDSDVSEVLVEGNNTLRVDFTGFLGIDFSSSKQDASAMTRFHMDFWTSSADLVGKVFNSKFSQWGGTAAEVSAFQLSINTGTTPAIESGVWVSIDVPISDWTNSPQTRDDIAQLIITSNLDIVYVDNIYLYKEAGGGGTGGIAGLPESFDTASSIDTWTTAASATEKPDEVTLEWAETAGVDGSGAMRFGGSNADAAGGRAYILEKTFTDIDFGGETSVDVSVSIKTEGIDNANISVLTDIAGSIQQNTSANADLNDATFTTLTFSHSAISGTANTVKLSFNVAAGAIVGAGGTLLIDDISVAAGTGGGGGGTDTPPTTAAPTPDDRNPVDVISLYSDAYTDITLDALSADFDDSDVTEVMIEGNSTLRIDFSNFLGIDFSSSKQDASAMTRFHMDFWTSSADLVGKVFNSKFSQWGGTAAEVSAFELNINTGTTPAIESGVWVSIDVPISNWTNSPQTRDDIAEFIITSNLDIVYVDNIYLYNDVPTSIEDPNVVPEDFELNQNYPNPFNPSTNIGFSLPQAERVTIKVYDMLGREVATLLNQQNYNAGSHQVTFDASNLSSGIYIYRLQAGTATFTKRMTLIK